MGHRPPHLCRIVLLVAGVASGLLGQCLLRGQDYGPAFANLRRLGLPDTKGAEWGKVSSGARGRQGTFTSRTPFAGEWNAELGGDSWLVEGNPESGRFTVVEDHARTVEFAPKASGEETRAGTWEPADLGADWKRLRKRFDDREFVDSLGGNPTATGEMILFAAHLERNGMEAEAAELVGQIRDASRDPERAITAAIDLVAKARYGDALEEAYESGDWQVFASSCRRLGGEFGRGWVLAEGIRALAELAAAQPPEPPTLEVPEGNSLTDEHRRLAAALGNLENPRSLASVGYMGPWLFADEATLVRFRQMGGGGMDPVTEIVEGGLANVPLLVALLEDSYLLPFSNPSNQVPADRIDRLLRKAVGDTGVSRGNSPLPHPATRADVAAILLAPLIPGLQAYGMSRDDFVAMAKDWWKRTRSKGPTEVARMYLREGTDAQVTAGITYLAEHGSGEDFSTIEDILLDGIGQGGTNALQSVTPYVEARGNAAAPFVAELESEVEAYLEALKRQGESQASQYDYYERTFEQQLSQVRSLISTESAEEMLAQVVDGEKAFDEVGQAILKKLSSRDYDERVSILLEAANHASDPAVRFHLIQSLSYLETPEGSTFRPRAHADLLRPLLEDSASAPNRMSVRITAAWVVDSLAAPQSQADLRAFWKRTGSSGADFLVSRTRARLEAGGNQAAEVPPFPSADHVAEDRRAELKETLLGVADDPAALREELEGLPLVEQMWVVGPPAEPGEEPSEDPSPLHSAIAKVQFAIVSVEAPEGWESLETLEGKQFSTERFDALVEAGLDRAAAGDSFVIELERDAGFGPFRLSVSPTPYAELAKEEDGAGSIIEMVRSDREEAQPFVAASLGGGSYVATWFPDTESGSADASRNEYGQLMKQQAQRTRENLAPWLQPPAGFSNDFTLSLVGTTAPPPETDSNDP